MKLSEKIALNAALAAVAFACNACASTQSVYIPTESELVCFGQADKAASDRADVECNGHLQNCPSKDAIIAQLQSALEACK